MARITVHVDIDAPRDTVWRAAADLGSHAEWMADAESIEITARAFRSLDVSLVQYIIH